METADELFMAGGESIAPRGHRWRPERLKAHAPKPRFGGKPARIRNHWTGLAVFLKGRRVEIDSHAAGNPVRPVMAARMRFPPAGRGNGAKARDCAALLIRSLRNERHRPAPPPQGHARGTCQGFRPGAAPRPHGGPFELQQGIESPRLWLNPGKPPHPAGLGEARPHANGRACPAGTRRRQYAGIALLPACGPPAGRLPPIHRRRRAAAFAPPSRRSAFDCPAAPVRAWAGGRGLFLLLRAAERQEAESPWRNPPERRRKALR